MSNASFHVHAVMVLIDMNIDESKNIDIFITSILSRSKICRWWEKTPSQKVKNAKIKLIYMIKSKTGLVLLRYGLVLVDEKLSGRFLKLTLYSTTTT